MASAGRHIPPEEWSAHENTIRHLYYIQKLPVQSKKNDRCLVRVLEDEYGFSATPEQYEMKFQEWRSAKNLKKHEWQQLLAQYEYLTARGIEARITVSGAVVDETKLKRQWRRYAPYPQPSAGVPEACNIPANRQAFVEVCGSGGSWSRYTGTEIVAHPESPAHTPTLPTTDNEVFTAGRISGDGITSGTSGLPVQGYASPSVGLSVTNARSPVNRSPNYTDVLRIVGQASPGFLGEEWLACWQNSEYHGVINFDDSWVNLPSPSGSFNPMAGPENPSWGQNGDTMMDSGAHGTLLGIQDPSRCSHTLVNSILQHFKQMQHGNVALVEHAGLPDAEDVFERFESVLPESLIMTTAESENRLGERNMLLGSGLQALVYSIVNGFAGLLNIPMKAVFATIRDEPKMQSQLFDLLKSSPPSIAKTLADNLFRAAVESCDAEAMTVIISVANCSPQAAIDPNEIRCNYEGRDYTPIELAAKFRNLEMVQALLAAKANPNKTYGQAKAHTECGALELAVRKWGEYKSVDMKLVNLLLQCGATVSISLVESVIHWGNEAKVLLEEVLDRALNASHEKLFKYNSILKITKNFENSAAARIITRFVQHCEKSNCAKCALRYSDTTQKAFEWAAYRGNLELVQCLSRFATASSLALAGAARSQNSHLVGFLLGQGAKVDSPVGYTSHDSPAVSTPLAEAIKVQDVSVTNDIEERGGYLCLAKDQHFCAAMSAAAEVGDINLVNKLFRFAPAYFEDDLAYPLCVAIRHHNTEIALLLLDIAARLADANPIGKMLFHPTNPLAEALKQRDRCLLDAMLQANDAENGLLLIKPTKHSSEIRYAVEWGDADIIEHLFLLGFRADGSALVAAMYANQISLVQRLLELGVDWHQYCADSLCRKEKSPLEVAVEKGNRELVSLLLSNGAPVNNQLAWEYAMDNDSSIFDLLIYFLKASYTPECKSLGGLLIIQAIHKRNTRVINRLIEARVDFNLVIRRNTARPSYEYTTFLGSRYLLNAIGFAVQHEKGTCYDLVQKLLDNGGDPNNIIDCDWRITGPSSQETLLLLAIEVRSLGMVKLLIGRGADTKSFKIVQFLLSKGVDPNEPPNPAGGRTSLQLAATNGSVRIAQLLLRHHADPHGPPARVRGKTALECAAENGRLHMLKLLWDAASPDGFPREEVQSARDLAREKGHRGCVDYIDSLLLGKPVDLLL
ncbi:hypothetical protein PG988_010635 [Apiospora saccharicola]